MRSSDDDAKVMLAELFYRRDDFQKAAASLSGVEVATNKLIISQYPTLNVAKLESFKGQTPYDVIGEGQNTCLRFLNADPLPLVTVRVNAATRSPSLSTPGFRRSRSTRSSLGSLAFRNSGKCEARFPAVSTLTLGSRESLAVGDWTIRNVPVATLALRQLSAGLGVKRIDGSIGATLLYHFLATLDYPHGELVLRRKTAQSREEFATASGNGVAVPFWIASDHFMVGWGRVETIPPALLFVDTGLAGAGVKLAEPVIKEAGIKLQEDKGYEGAGGGGTLKNRALRCASPFLRKHTGRQRRGSLRWAVPVGKLFWLPSCGHGRPRFLQTLCGDL